MKKYAFVACLVALTTLTLSGCSSAEVSPSASDLPAEAGADGGALSALNNPDAAASASAEPSAGAVVDTANSASTIADNSSYSPSSDRSPVNLGASSAGRAH